MLLGRNVQAGDKVAVEATGVQVTVDVADFEQIADPAAKPSGAVSVTDHGADPGGQGDSTQAFRSAIAAAQGGTVWIPPGSTGSPRPSTASRTSPSGAREAGTRSCAAPASSTRPVPPGTSTWGTSP
ncbi:hypothetical protein SHKM778_37240 [Streptomyces sp. KM77-8]|uniref:Rhamnogalacturonase A/B/Epimerase-like pectate lyase domain-containing protein n=1 Tax=Streptomyces haneummycinicus TaxID=3074435 RepID=A0AAT9HIT9_9ACTN